MILFQIISFAMDQVEEERQENLVEQEYLYIIQIAVLLTLALMESPLTA